MYRGTPAIALLPLFAAPWLTAGAPAAPGSVLEAAQVATAELATATSDQLTDQVAVTLHDENHRTTRTFLIGRDGTVDDETREALEQMFRCKRTERHRKIDRGLLAMLADVAAHYPGRTIEYVSAFRALDSSTSRHKQGRAFDFRIPGVPSTEVRDYVWTRHTEVGVGWYPEGNFIHMDHRPGARDYAWTQIKGRERKNPIWAVKARRNETLPPSYRGVGL